MGASTTVKRLALVMAPAVMLAAVGPAGAQEDEVDELTIGEWQGGAEAWGTARASGEGTEIEWSARIVSTFTFTVSQAGVADGSSGIDGRFDISSEGLLGGDSMTMNAVTQGQEYTADFDIDPGAGGEISGSRSELLFNSGIITTSASVSAGGQTFDVAGTPSQITIENTIGYLACDHAIGDWDVSITQQIEAESWAPSWSGYWAAVPVLDEDSETAEEEFIDGLEELFDDYRQFESTLGTSLGPDPTYDPTVLDPGTLHGLVTQATELMNTLHNLSRCDQEAIGAETLQEWQTALAGVVGDLVLTAADALARMPNKFLDLSGLYPLVHAVDGSNAYRGAGEGFQVEQAMIELTSKAAEGHLRLSRGEGAEACNASCRQNEYLWAAGAIAVATTHGWPVTVEGTTYSPADAPQLLNDPPDAEGES